VLTPPASTHAWALKPEPSLLTPYTAPTVQEHHFPIDGIFPHVVVQLEHFSSSIFVQFHYAADEFIEAILHQWTDHPETVR